MAASWQALHCCILLWCTACVAQQSPPSLWDSLGSNSPLTVQSIGSDPPKAPPPHVRFSCFGAVLHSCQQSLAKAQR